MTKNIYSLSLLAIVFTGTELLAQVDPPCLIPGATLCDDIESYTEGDEIGPQCSWWSTWDGTEGDISDGLVSDDYAYSGTQSLLIPEGSNSDVLLLLGNQTTGVWRLRWMMYVPNEKTGYYNIQDSETPGIAWDLEVLFGLYDYVTPAPSGEGTVLVPDTYDFSYPVDQWFMVDHIIDLDANNIEMYVNGDLVFSSAYTGNIGSIDFYSIDANNRYYIDDVLLIDNALLSTYYADTDDDGFGDPDNSIAVVGEAPSGFVVDNTDCNDEDASIYPGATETCNTIDDNCDGNIDEGLLITFYVDADGDSFGDADATEEACELTAGLSDNSADCDDTNPDIYPGATEITNGVDDDCDEMIDENVSVEDILFANGISVYPVPASGYFMIDIPPTDEPVVLHLMDISGRVVYTNEFGAGVMTSKIDVSNLASGVYQIEIIAGNAEAVKQIVINQ